MENFGTQVEARNKKKVSRVVITYPQFVSDWRDRVFLGVSLPLII